MLNLTHNIGNSSTTTITPAIWDQEIRTDLQTEIKQK